MLIISQNQECTFTPNLFERSQTVTGGVAYKYSPAVQGPLQIKGFHLLSFDHHFPPFLSCFGYGSLWLQGCMCALI